jgi:ATP-dependent DNA ligase
MKFDSFTYWYPERPVLVPPASSLIDKLSDHPTWIAQPKYNGNRLQLHFLNGEWQFWNRHKARLNFKPDAELKQGLDLLASRLQGYWLMDGELRDRKVKGIRSQIVLWDVFLMNGLMLNNSTYLQRRQILSGVMAGMDGPPLELIKQFKTDFRGVFSDLIQDPEIEGIVMKNLDGKLNLSRTSGQDSAWMLKVRRPNGSYRF